MVLKRIVSLDAFRGLTIMSMILVNTPGSWKYVYAPLRHSEWHGCTPTDLVFPFFLFIVGVAMWFSFRAFDHKPSSAAVRKIIRRTILIFIIGMALNAFPFFGRDYANFRILGVLQRIALAFGIGAFLCLFIEKKKLFILSFLILLGYWVLLWLFVGENPYSLEHNLAGKIDIAIFGKNHVYHGFGIAFDPEGILSSIPAAVTVIFGFLTGSLIGNGVNKKAVAIKLLIWGVASILSGLFWNIWFPINKPLWTSSYVIYTAGIALVIISLFYWLIDVLDLRKWTFPFVVYGKNPLFAYILSIIWVKIYFMFKLPAGDGGTVSVYGWLYNNVFAPIAGDINGSLLFAIFHIVIFWLILLILYRRKIIIKI